MRPVNKGDRPLRSNGIPVEFTEYKQARPFLINILGEYCSYCEMHLDASLEVEHVLPKSVHPELGLEWTNLLLSCGNCNPTKGDKDIVLTEYFWPDIDNSIIPYIYSRGGVIKTNPDLDISDQVKARKTLKLLGLDKNMSTRNYSDRRWQNRKEAWEKASRSLKRLKSNDSIELREEIAEHVTSNGYFSIWMTVFKEDSDMLKRFIDAFPGTCRECFDPEGKPVPRNPNGI